MIKYTTKNKCNVKSNVNFMDFNFKPPADKSSVILAGIFQFIKISGLLKEKPPYQPKLGDLLRSR